MRSDIKFSSMAYSKTRTAKCTSSKCVTYYILKGFNLNSYVLYLLTFGAHCYSFEILYPLLIKVTGSSVVFLDCSYKVCTENFKIVSSGVLLCVA